MRSMSRVLTAAAVILTLALLSVPAANARPLDHQAPAVHQQASSWVQSALAWLSSFLGHHGATGQGLLSATSGTATPMTGSCIDPQGGRCTL